MDISKLLVGKPIEKDVTFADGTVEKCWFQPVSAADFKRWTWAEQSNEDRHTAMQLLIQKSLCADSSGKLALTEKQAAALTMDAVNSLFPVVVEVSRATKEEKKD